MLEGLQAKIGKYAVFGVHDYYNKSPKEFLKNMVKKQKKYQKKNDVSRLISKLGSIGIKVLRNERASHAIGNDFAINITGLEDSIIGKTDIAKAFAATDSKDSSKTDNAHNTVNCNEAAAGKPANFGNDDLLRSSGKKIHNLNDSRKMEICLTHTPDMDLFGCIAENGVDIILAGHTHGGQVRLPGIGAIISGCNLRARHASGLFYFKKFVLYISRGLGEGRYSPFRFYCQPEASFISINFK